MKSFLDSFLTPLRNTFTKAKEVAQPLFVDAVNRVGESIQNINIPDISNPNNPISNTAKPYIENLVNPQRTIKTLSTLDGQKNLVEQVGMGMGPEMMVQTKVALPIFKGAKNLTTKVLKNLEGKNLVSRQFIEDSLKMAGLKKGEIKSAKNVLESFAGDKIPVKKFAKKVEDELLPLERTHVNNFYTEVSDSQGQYEKFSLPSELRGNVAEYSERVYESPIKTSAGLSHFSNENPQNYFGHTRVEDMNNGEIRRVIEVQSDLYQKGNLKATSMKEYENIGSTPSREITKNWTSKDWDNLEKQREKAYKIASKETKQLEQYNDPTAHFRMVREEVKQAAIDGKTKLQFPTGETAMKIEGLGEQTTWRELYHDGNYNLTNGARKLSPDKLEVGQMISRDEAGFGNQANLAEQDRWIITDVLGDGKFKAVPKKEWEALSNPEKGTVSALPEVQNNLERFKETFDISGKVDTNNPIYKFYEKDLGKYLQNKYKAKLITDPQGVSWYELDVPKEAGKVPVEAFSVIPFIKPKEDKKELFISK